MFEMDSVTMDFTTEKLEMLDFARMNISASDNDTILNASSPFVDNTTLTQKVFFGSLMLSLIVVTIIGNGLVMVAVAMFEHLRTVANMFIVSLAIADMTVAVLVMPVSLVAVVAPEVTIPWRFCFFWISCDVMCCTASILHLCLISRDRFLAIKHALTYHKKMTKGRAIFWICAVWICSIGISFAPIYLGWYSDQVPDYSRSQWAMHECGLNDISMTYALVSSSISFTVPLCVMIGAYFKIFKIAQRQVKEIARFVYVPCNERHSPRQDNMRRRSRQVTRDMKAVRTLGILMGVFIACWLPFFLMYVIMATCNHCTLPNFLETGITWLGYVNSFANPCVYAFMNKDFRHAFWKLISCKTSSCGGGGALDSTNTCGRLDTTNTCSKLGTPIKFCFRKATAGCERSEAVQL